MGKSYNLTDVPDDVWSRWVNSFPREQSINERLVHLIREDADD